MVKFGRGQKEVLHWALSQMIAHDSTPLCIKLDFVDDFYAMGREDLGQVKMPTLTSMHVFVRFFAFRTTVQKPGAASRF